MALYTALIVAAMASAASAFDSATFKQNCDTAMKADGCKKTGRVKQNLECTFTPTCLRENANNEDYEAYFCINNFVNEEQTERRVSATWEVYGVTDTPTAKTRFANLRYQLKGGNSVCPNDADHFHFADNGNLIVLSCKSQNSPGGHCTLSDLPSVIDFNSKTVKRGSTKACCNYMSHRDGNTQDIVNSPIYTLAVSLSNGNVRFSESGLADNSHDGQPADKSADHHLLRHN